MTESILPTIRTANDVQVFAALAKMLTSLRETPHKNIITTTATITVVGTTAVELLARLISPEHLEDIANATATTAEEMPGIFRRLLETRKILVDDQIEDHGAFCEVWYKLQDVTTEMGLSTGPLNEAGNFMIRNYVRKAFTP